MIAFLITVYTIIALIVMKAIHSSLNKKYPANPNVLKWIVAVFYGTIWVLVPFIQMIFRVGLDKDETQTKNI